jgi:acyl-activating enzyme 14
MALAHVCLSLHQRSPSITQEAICQKNECLSHSDLSVKVIALSNALTTQLNLRPGQVAAVLSSNTDVFLYSLMAIVDAGGIVAPLNTRWSAQEAAAATQLCHATFLFAEPSLTSIVTDIFKRCSRLRAVVWLGQAPSPHSFAINAPYVSTNTLMQAQLLYTHTPRTLQLQQPSSGTAFICFTSGTTGTPKGVALSHTALHYQSMAKLATVGYSRDDIYLHMAPLFHVGGISSALAVTAAAAGRHVLMPRYSAAEAWRLMQQHRVTALIAVPTMIDDLARHGAAQRSQGGSSAGCVSSVTKLLVGAGGMSQQLQVGCCDVISW